MRKILIWLTILLVVLLISAYTLLPGKISFSEVVRVKAPGAAVSRFLTDEAKWNQYWHNKNKNDKKVNGNPDSPHIYKNFEYHVNLKTIWGDSILIKNNHLNINSSLHIVPFGTDSVALQWSGESASTSDPYTRLRNYLHRNEICNNVKVLLTDMKAFLEKKENFYGIHIDQIMVKDTLLVATRHSSNNYPTTPEIYSLIQTLRDYIKKVGAIETNFPMLHITTDSVGYMTMTAIPVNKYVPTNKNFLFKRMVPGKILVTEVIGGIHTTANALKQLELYISDHQLQSPAIPFESLVMDRSKQPDTSKWITKVYYPIY
jgi:hypothetical protein